MKPGRFVKTIMISVFMLCMIYTTAIAGTYSETESIRGSFSSQFVMIQNTLGATFQAHPYEFSPLVSTVNSITGYYKVNSISLKLYNIDVDVFYSTDGSNYICGDCIKNVQAGGQYTYSISFGRTTKTIAAIAFVPNILYNPGMSYTVQPPRFTLVKEDNTVPEISLSEQSDYSKDSVTVTALIKDTQCGLSICKWAQGIQNLSYFSVSGNAFTDTFTVTENGYYTIYAMDFAWNEAVTFICVTKIDRTPPVISASVPAEWDTSNTITVNISDSQSGVSVEKWAFGNYPAAYFSSDGNTLSGSMVTVTSNGVYTIYAKDTAGNESVSYVTVSYVDNTVSITHPLFVDYVIDPNLSTPFTASDIRFVNNSRIKVSVSVQELSSSTDASLYFLNASPSAFSNWDTLNVTQSKTYIALGLKVKETSTASNSWYSISAYNPIYACDITSSTLLGILNPNGAYGNLSLCAKQGLAWDNNYTSKHKLVFLFETYS